MSTATAEASMAQPSTSPTVDSSTTSDAFLTDKQHFLHAFTMFITAGVAGVILLLVLMAIFLL